MMYDPLNNGIGYMFSSSGSQGYPSPFGPGLGPDDLPLDNMPLGGQLSPTGVEPFPSEPTTTPYPSPFGPGGPGLFPPFGGGTQGGIMDALNPHKSALYEDYNPKKVDRFFKRVEQMSNRFFPGYTGGGGPQIIY